MHASEVHGLPMVIREFRGRPYRLPAHPVVLQIFDDETNIRDVHWLIEPGDVVVDAGSHFGSYTIPALACGATVYAVDPDDRVNDVMNAILDLNPDLPGYLIMLREALTDREGLTPFFRAELEKRFEGLGPHPGMMTPLDCAYSSLDQLAEDEALARFDWLKIDVEGLELGVLRGAEKTLQTFAPTIIIEDHTAVYPFVREMGSTQQCVRLLKELGYRVQAGIPYTGTGLERTYILAAKTGVA
jgi:FkbM family methyltransferase